MKQNIQTCTLSENQQGIFFETMRVSYAVYISQMCLTLKGAFNYKLFQQAYCYIIKRHEILRSSFETDKIQNIPIQIVHEEIEPIIAYYDYLGLDSKQKTTQYNQFIKIDQETSFDFNISPLMRLTVIRYSELEHRIIWTRHHILLDGSSVKLILSELFTIYHALLNDKFWSLSPNSSYFEVKEKFKLKCKNDAINYWKKQLQFFSESSFLPDIPLRYSEIKNFKQLNSILSQYDFLTLLELVSKHSLTINSILQAAWAIVLSHYSNNEHIIFGSVRAYPKEEVKNCAGLFINTLPLALKVDPKISVINFLKFTREQGKKLRDYVYSSLSDIRQWLGLPLDTFLYQSIIDYKPYSINKIINTEFEGLDCSISLHLTTPYPLALEIENETDYLSIQLNYCDLFTERFAQGILNHFTSIIKSICTDPDQTILDLPSLNHEDWLKSVVHSNNTEKAYPLDRMLHQLFEEQVDKSPNAIALSYKNKNLTYKKLNNQANQLAHFIIKQGIKFESLVVILTGPSINALISLLAVLKAGGAYVPIDMKYPFERIKYLINDSCTDFVICDNKTEQMVYIALKGSSEPKCLINLDTVPLHLFSSSNPDLNLSASSLAYMIYTSGSTGTPKGVMVEHRSVVNMVLGCMERLKVSPESRILQIASFSFDVAVAEWGLALLSGASLYLIDKEVFNPCEIVDVLRFYKITTIILASSILTALPHYNLPDLKVIAVGGESCSEAVISFWAENRLFLNVYGITETTVCSTIGDCYPGQDQLTIGRPLPNTQVYILNKFQQPTPVGICGEIYIGGSGVARGYKNKNDLTKERFIKNPMSQQLALPYDRLYKTGDKGRWLPNGELEFLGRVDEQVKVAGIRVELLEIEKAIEQYPSIEKAAVILYANKQLQAFILSNEKDFDQEEVKQFLRKILPYALIPNRFIKIDEIPLTSNGKIDKVKLVDFYSEIKEAIDVSQENLTTIEKIILSGIQKITGLERLPINRSFLDLGLKSIELVELSVKVSTLLNQDIRVIDLFNHPTIKTLASHIDNLKHKHDEGKLDIKRHPVTFKRQSRHKRINFNQDNHG